MSVLLIYSFIYEREVFPFCLFPKKPKEKAPILNNNASKFRKERNYRRMKDETEE